MPTLKKGYSCRIDEEPPKRAIIIDTTPDENGCILVREYGSGLQRRIRPEMLLPNEITLGEQGVPE